MRWSTSKSIPPPSVKSSSSAVVVPSDVIHVWLWGRGTCRVTSYSWSSRCSLSCSFKTDSCVCSLCLWRHHRAAEHALKIQTSLVLLRRHSKNTDKDDRIFNYKWTWFGTLRFISAIWNIQCGNLERCTQITDRQWTSVVTCYGLITAMCKKYAAFFISGRKTLVLSASFGQNTLDITMGFLANVFSIRKIRRRLHIAIN